MPSFEKFGTHYRDFIDANDTGIRLGSTGKLFAHVFLKNSSLIAIGCGRNPRCIGSSKSVFSVGIRIRVFPLFISRNPFVPVTRSRL